MNLKDSFNGEAVKESYHKCRKEVMKYTAVVADKFKTLINDIRIEQLSRLSRNAKIGIGAGILGVAVFSTVLVLNSGTDVYKVTIAGQEAGYVTEQEMVGTVLEEIKTDLSQKASGIEIVVDSDALVCEETDLKKKEVTILTNEELKDKILTAELCKAKAWAVNINGDNVVAAATEEGANSILEGVKNHYKTEGSEVLSASFKEDVLVTQAAVNVADIMKPEEAVSLIVTGTKEPKVYTVQDGDTLWDIAIANGMTPTELESANTGFDPAKLKIGQQLNLYQVKPYVTVQIKEVVANTEKIDFGIVYESTSALYKGEVKVKTAGVYGTKEIRTEVTKENGIVVATKELDSVVTAEPQNQIALKGTKSLATFTGTGSLSSPVSHIEISSAFGANRGGSRHTGVDLRNPKGTPIKAADDGVVTFAAYSGSYGNLVKLSHGNGIETWYAHCNTIGVSVGQVVSKGEVIATVGITGRATGYHLHFEVRKNGVPQNPMNYL
ncbi:peptidoglycan DD-metalloendopeptidase family protein [Sinanaerobacter chloroacetimidivorans]|jgi:murein DD-endopeptidase MepM/ murein hydrolase activator NlpD|uniref:Peptidoglycan DD-metalloendopeptidase family protein n=1 Tax=Sinanaerobacter chloroacetimidivorans TaxID=2818044 RepID=A0A8J7W7C7_9FIRM|nr:peptidoglycan DD-metalloendopeptidase family protein [Sinanaerobacter chloroacetimidivorans]MBR0600465.1 peptidoglycan DD-metalloendopeptidase family protein [Sinanaerobacter chloroacetimidivorans]